MRALFFVVCLFALAVVAVFAPELDHAPRLAAAGSLALGMLGFGALRNAG